MSYARVLDAVREAAYRRLGKTGDHQTLGQALEAKRAELGLTRYDFAHQLGIDSSGYARVVAGTRDIHIRAARKAYALGVPANLLLGAR